MPAAPEFRIPAGTGVLLLNLGTPDAPEPAAIRRFLRAFLSDRRVVDLPRWRWWPILHGVILPLRPRRLAPAYRSIWTDEGSPLLALTRRLAARLQELLGAPVEAGMRYGNPSTASALRRLRDAGVTRLVAVPLYPQFSRTTTASARDALDAALAAQATPLLHCTFIQDYHLDAGYVDALRAGVETHWSARGRGDHLLISFHSIPRRYVAAGDPYEAQCRATAARLAAALDLADGEWSLAYQSRLGREPWLQPYTDVRLAGLAAEGVRTLDVLCPGFAVECLETLEEVALRYAAAFHSAGGGTLRYIPALNDDPSHVAALARIVSGGGPNSPGSAA